MSADAGVIEAPEGVELDDNVPPAHIFCGRCADDAGVWGQPFVGLAYCGRLELCNGRLLFGSAPPDVCEECARLHTEPCPVCKR